MLHIILYTNTTFENIGGARGDSPHRFVINHDVICTDLSIRSRTSLSQNLWSLTIILKTKFVRFFFLNFFSSKSEIFKLICEGGCDRSVVSIIFRDFRFLLAILWLVSGGNAPPRVFITNFYFCSRYWRNDLLFRFVFVFVAFAYKIYLSSEDQTHWISKIVFYLFLLKISSSSPLSPIVNVFVRFRKARLF